MAKLGEGDARWIVQERQDGKNVNAWHWQEKNMTSQWTQSLKEMLEGQLLEASAHGADVHISVTKTEGEVSCYQRYSRIYFAIFFRKNCIKAGAGVSHVRAQVGAGVEAVHRAL